MCPHGSQSQQSQWEANFSPHSGRKTRRIVNNRSPPTALHWTATNPGPLRRNYYAFALRQLPLWICILPPHYFSCSILSIINWQPQSLARFQERVEWAEIGLQSWPTFEMANKLREGRREKGEERNNHLIKMSLLFWKQTVNWQMGKKEASKQNGKIIIKKWKENKVIRNRGKKANWN